MVYRRVSIGPLHSLHSIDVRDRTPSAPVLRRWDRRSWYCMPQATCQDSLLSATRHQHQIEKTRWIPYHYSLWKTSLPQAERQGGLHADLPEKGVLWQLRRICLIFPSPARSSIMHIAVRKVLSVEKGSTKWLLQRHASDAAARKIRSNQISAIGQKCSGPPGQCAATAPTRQAIGSMQ